MSAMNKTERLIIAGHVAPILRDKTPRPIRTVDAAGKVVRTITDLELNEALLARERIELAVVDDVAKCFCSQCGTRLRSRARKSGLCQSCWRRKGKGKELGKPVQRCEECGLACKLTRRSISCAECISKRTYRCSTPGCSIPISKLAYSPCFVRRRKGEPPVCRDCAGKVIGLRVRATLASMSPDQLQRRMRRLVANRRPVSADRRAEISRGVAASKSPEERTAILRKAWATRKERRRS